MGGVKADWHLADLAVPQAEQMISLEALADPVDLDVDDGELRDALVRLVNKEAGFWAKGITCDLKQEQGVNCNHCSVFTDDATELRSCLCRLGREQLDIVNLIERRAEMDEAEELALAAMALDPA